LDSGKSNPEAALSPLSASAATIAAIQLSGTIMWKLLAGFAVFAALAIYVMSKGGDIDMGGEKHDVAAHAEAASAPASAASN